MSCKGSELGSSQLIDIPNGDDLETSDPDPLFWATSCKQVSGVC